MKHSDMKNTIVAYMALLMAPSKVMIDVGMPTHQAKRDLISDMADELDKRAIALCLYVHPMDQHDLSQKERALFSWGPEVEGLPGPKLGQWWPNPKGEGPDGRIRPALAGAESFAPQHDAQHHPGAGAYYLLGHCGHRLRRWLNRVCACADPADRKNGPRPRSEEWPTVQRGFTLARRHEGQNQPVGRRRRVVASCRCELGSGGYGDRVES